MYAITGNLLSATGRAVGAATFRIAATAMPDIVVPSGLRPFVRRAAEDVAADLERIFGVLPRIVPTPCSSDGNGAILLAKAGSGWENYAVESMPDNVLRITGSDDRGVMFGLYRFASDCRCCPLTAEHSSAAGAP